MPRNRPLVFDLVLTVADAHVWRRVRISSGATLARAQRVLCVAFEWPGGRPYAFSVGHLRYESIGRGDDIVDIRLRQLLSGVGDALEFEYGEMPAPAVVRARVDCVLPAHDGMVTPTCLAGEGLPERDGLAAVSDAGEDDEEHTALVSLNGARGRPLPLNLAAINAELARLH